MKEFERQNAKMDQVEEMMGDAMDDVFEVRCQFHPAHNFSTLRVLVSKLSCANHDQLPATTVKKLCCERMQGGDEEEETDKLVMQVFEEIGINAADGMVSAPQAAVPAQQAAIQEAAPEPMAAAAEAGPSGVDAELEARLNALRGK